jgi:hypothetical protein
MGGKTMLWNQGYGTAAATGDDMGELELYPRTNWKRVISVGLASVLVVGWAGYRWITTATPVDSAQAVELFRDEIAAEPGDEEVKKKPSKRERDRGTAKRDRSRRNTRSPAADATGTTGAPASRDTTKNPPSGGAEQGFSRPGEGVYSWATDGYEEVSGARREFPEESQRILTWSGSDGWVEHHYFSEQREIWTNFRWGPRGAEVMQQRNKVTFGPVTNESTIDFSPPMLVGPRDLKVGYEWGDTWEGQTHGDYSSKVFEHTTMAIGGEEVEVWGLSYVINLRGQQEGRVTAEVWLAPSYGLTVQEHYEQDIRSDGAHYQAEWTQKLKSLEPRR